MWNYSFVLPNLAVIAVFLVYYLMRPRVPVKVVKAFPRILFVEVLLILIDPISSHISEKFSGVAIPLQVVSNVIYFMLFFLRGYIFFKLTAGIVKISVRRHIFLFVLSAAILIVSQIAALSNIFHEVLFSISENGYKVGKFYNILYAFSLYFIGASFACIFIRWKSVDFWRARISLVFNTVLLVGYIFRATFPRWLLMDSFCILAIVIIYSKFESSALYMDSTSGVFNSKGLSDYFDEILGKNLNLVFSFSIRNCKEMREMFSNRQIDFCIGMIGKYLLAAFPKLSSFYLGDGVFVLIGKDEGDYEAVKSSLSERFSRQWTCDDGVSVMLKANFVYADGVMKVKDPELLIKALIELLRQAEFPNGGDIVVTDERLKGIEGMASIKRAVEYAAETKSTKLFLQPIVDANTFELVGAEALARICDFSGKIISPALFIPIAEKNGRINLIGENMFEMACEFFKNHNQGGKLSWINVNLSPIQFMWSDLHERFSAILARNSLDEQYMHLEITEESMIDFDVLQNQLDIMIKKGFKFVLDDYGKGYSNVARLSKCNVINVKIDMEIVWNHFKSNDSILPAIVKSLKAMNFTVTAEGIETELMARQMAEMGCDYLQGYYFSQPLPADEFAAKYGL